ncbi:thioesterase II family protein [Kitasatospora sp. NPDC057015]|uniref:thioesterase II family protein n=1 Tax=Kitasatospora sp. NPDC057015 TaxID=3346001 RepID=UPI00362EC00D
MDAPATPRWTIRAPGSERSARTLYCLPHGGGSAAEYVRWARDLRRVAVCAVQLPGRGSRLEEPAPTGMDELVGTLVEELVLNPPYVLFGHSFGALVAYEFAQALRTAGRPLPERLILSSYPAPHLPRESSGLHRLPDGELLAEVARLHGGIPDEVLGNAELSRLAAHCVRADYRIVETYSWRPRPPLPVPITVLGGRDDVVSEEQLAAWCAHTTMGPIRQRTFAGGHFYFRERQRAAVLRTVEAAAC